MTQQSTNSGFFGQVHIADVPHFSSAPQAKPYLSCKVVYRGYIANRQELVDLLRLSSEDVSIAGMFVAAYRRWGAELQRYVLGEYCVAIFDELLQILLLTHDAVGLRPLYYKRLEGGIVFSSHPALLAPEGAKPDLDEQFVAAYLVYGHHYGDRTVYRDVLRLGAGQTLLWSGNDVRILRTWTLASIKPIGYKSPSDYDDHFLELLQKGVRAASDGKTWVELSGGLDSSSVVCIAAAMGGKEIEAISVIYSQSITADEKEWADEVLSLLSIRGHFIDGDHAKAFSTLPDRFVEEPTRTSNNWLLFMRYEELMQAHGASVLLSGLGGDQALYGEAQIPIYLADRFVRFNVAGIWTELTRWQQSRPAQRSKRFMFSQSVIRPLIRYFTGRSLIGGIPGGVPWLNSEFKSRIGIDPGRIPGASPRMPNVMGQLYHERISQISLVSGQLSNQLTTKYEVRYPLLYRPLIEFMYALPPEQQIQPGQTRSLQRRALAGILPEKIRMRRDKKGPDESLFKGLRLNKSMRALLTDCPQVVQRGFVDAHRWSEAVQLASLGHVKAIRSFLSTTSLEMWLQQFAKGTREPAPSAAPRRDFDHSVQSG
jgi:asparagine synthase (glutamine-hydrolysing)